MFNLFSWYTLSTFLHVLFLVQIEFSVTQCSGFSFLSQPPLLAFFISYFPDHLVLPSLMAELWILSRVFFSLKLPSNSQNKFKLDSHTKISMFTDTLTTQWPNTIFQVEIRPYKYYLFTNKMPCFQKVVPITRCCNHCITVHLNILMFSH